MVREQQIKKKDSNGVVRKLKVRVFAGEPF